MHGRLKVKTTEEQDEAKRLERLKKLKIYQGAMAKIFAKRNAGGLDKEALQLTGGVLSKNPDVYTLWNYRKEIFLHLQKTTSVDEMTALFKEELSFLESCLGNNPKSYGSWEHRCFVMLHTPKPDWERELMLCTTFLTYDERNFHCWDYRRFVIKQSEVAPEEELKFTYEKIANNFSNYSSWHYRSKLLPQVFPSDTSHSSGLQQSALQEEMDLVQNAFFTDPNDQSAWFYHRWLLGRVEHPLELIDVNRQANNRLILTFASAIRIIGDSASGAITEAHTDESWTSPDGQSYSSVWYCAEAQNIQSVKVQSKTKMYEYGLDNPEDYKRKQAIGLYFRHAMTATTNDLLLKELESCEQLFDLEPDNKWVLLTIVLLMKSIDPTKYEEGILSHLQKLTEVDSLRRNYYLDLRSRFIWEEKLTSLSSLEISLSHRGLTSIHHTHFVYDLTSLDLSHNHLTSVAGVNYLQRLKSLNLANNRINSCAGLANMASLTHLDLSNNAITKQEVVDEIKMTCPALNEVCIEGNPCVSTTE